MRQCLGPVEQIRAGGRAEAIFSPAASRLSVGTRACRGMEHMRPRTTVPCRRAKWENRTKRAFEKAAGNERFFYSWPMVGLADMAGLDTILDTADVEAGRGIAKQDGIIHRYI